MISIFLLIFYSFHLGVLCETESGQELTLRNLVRFGENSALFDSLSSAVEQNLQNQPAHHEVEPHEASINRTLTMSRLNAQYSDILLEHDIRPNRAFLEEMLEEMTSKGRVKRQAYRKKTYPREIWSDGVPVAYHRSMNRYKKYTVIAAMKYFQRHTCIRFRKRTKEDVYLYYIGHDAGCWSTVGRDPSQRQQWISIGDGCEPFGISSHEVAHALGLFHEQSRYDRDKFIHVLANRVPKGLYYNFGKVGISSLKTYGIPYEIGSVMHYGPTECPEGFAGRQCTRREAPSVIGCGGVVRATHAPQKIRIHIKRNEKATHLRNCIYHLAAPKGKRVEVRLNKLRGTLCETGCWRQAIELKPHTDKRITGYRFCCAGYASRRIVSANHFMPIFLFTTRGDTEATLTFNIYNPQGRQNPNQTIEEGSGIEVDDHADISDYLINESEELEKVAHDTLIEESFPDGEMDPLSFIHPADMPTEEELRDTDESVLPIDTEAFEKGRNPAQNRIPFREADKELRS
ncbi:unnamed protein product, partial [Mesorhabditis belari]|uniref:Metalloendopeptidase n=1 Tax=Mesorhabditis belari TaxID=2138241 RepID=A0AAF3EYH3_9BILA